MCRNVVVGTLESGIDYRGVLIPEYPDYRGVLIPECPDYRGVLIPECPDYRGSIVVVIVTAIQDMYMYKHFSNARYIH